MGFGHNIFYSQNVCHTNPFRREAHPRFLALFTRTMRPQAAPHWSALRCTAKVQKKMQVVTLSRTFPAELTVDRVFHLLPSLRLLCRLLGPARPRVHPRCRLRGVVDKVCEGARATAGKHKRGSQMVHPGIDGGGG